MNTKRMYVVDYVSEVLGGEDLRTEEIFANKLKAYKFAKLQATETNEEVAVGVADLDKDLVYEDTKGVWNYEDNANLYQNYKLLYKLMRGYKFAGELYKGGK